MNLPTLIVPGDRAGLPGADRSMGRRLRTLIRDPGELERRPPQGTRRA